MNLNPLRLMFFLLGAATAHATGPILDTEEARQAEADLADVAMSDAKPVHTPTQAMTVLKKFLQHQILPHPKQYPQGTVIERITHEEARVSVMLTKSRVFLRLLGPGPAREQNLVFGRARDLDTPDRCWAIHLMGGGKNDFGTCIEEKTGRILVLTRFSN